MKDSVGVTELRIEAIVLGMKSLGYLGLLARRGLREIVLDMVGLGLKATEQRAHVITKIVCFYLGAALLK